MSTPHTQGKLAYLESPYDPNRFTIGADGKWLMTIQHNGEQWVEVQRENMRRLAACWNACDGIPTNRLEKAADDIAPVFGLLMDTTQQLDSLLAACKLWLADDLDDSTLRQIIARSAQ